MVNCPNRVSQDEKVVVTANVVYKTTTTSSKIIYKAIKKIFKNHGSADNRGATKKSAVKNIVHYKAIVKIMGVQTIEVQPKRVR